MSTKVCPTCEGLCCREGSGMHSMHRVRVYTKHVCPDCDAGLVWATHTESAPRSVRTAADERADVLEWLHQQVRAPGASPDERHALADAYRAVIHNLHVGLGLTKKEKP